MYVIGRGVWSNISINHEKRHAIGSVPGAYLLMGIGGIELQLGIANYLR